MDSKLAEIKAFVAEHGYNGLTGSDAVWLITWVDRLRAINAELLAEVKRTLALFEAVSPGLPQVPALRDLVKRAEGE